MILRLRFLLVLFICFSATTIYSQENDGIAVIINQIKELEQDKDPKCYATASRLEDFMYGTPLSEGARNLKIEIQKSIIYYLKKKGSEIAKSSQSKTIALPHLKDIVNKISTYVKAKDGSYQYKFGSGYIPISKLDFNQYSSVSYSFRSILSVEQDLLFSSEQLLPFAPEAIQPIADYVNLITLVVLKIADNSARKANLEEITKDLMKNTWITVLNESNNQHEISALKYPNLVSSESNESNTILKGIINQKLASYKKYNQINASVFLRNIQVYLAKQKWPTETLASTTLKNYYLESLVQFSSGLIASSSNIAATKKHILIRPEDIQAALITYLPSETNKFEDVSFFSNNQTDKITIESYDLDAFRDSGIHWTILDYSINDNQARSNKSLDPNAAEILVEGIAQMGVLVLRLAGNSSHAENKPALDIKDIESGFIKLQTLISTYKDIKNIETKNDIISSTSSNKNTTVGFVNTTNKALINFEHKSSDWLNRLIRSFTLSNTEKVAKLAIPPAFGGSGVATEDMNNDGFIDIILLGGFGNKFFLNNTDGTFRDITEISGINKTWNSNRNSFGEPRQPIVADFNNDGTQDLFISYVNDSHKIYQNKNHNKMIDMSQNCGLGGKNNVAGPATAFDYDNDGLLDIYIGYFGNYVDGDLPTLSRDNQNGQPNKLFKNLGNFVFKEVMFTENTTSNTGWTQALGHADINQDGLQDIIVGNDFGKNKYYLNNKNGLFTEASQSLGTDKPSYTMNVGITDLNKDLYPDFYISNIVVMQKDEKYVSPNQDTEMKFDPEKMANIRTLEANDLFLSNTTKSKGLKGFQLSKNIGRGFSSTGWSWDADFFDFDNDGDEDLYCLNGMNDFSVYSSENPFYFERKEQSKSIVYAKSSREKNVFFVNDNGTLLNKAKELNVDLMSNARSASYLDYDNDGDLDIIINNYHDKATLLENKNVDNNWIKIKLIGSPENNINKDAIGSSMVLNSKSHKNVWREIHSTTGYLSVHPKVQHFGLGKDEMVSIEVRWSNGKTYVIEDVLANYSYTVAYPNLISR